MSTIQTVAAPASESEDNAIRIPHVLAALERYWMQNPGLSLGQIVETIAGESSKTPESLADETLLESLKAKAPSWNR